MESLLRQVSLRNTADLEPVPVIAHNGRQITKARIMHLVGNAHSTANHECQQQPFALDRANADLEGCQVIVQEQQSASRWISANTRVAIRAIAVEYHQVLQDKPLSQREMEVLRLIVEGDTNAEIAKKLYLTPGTVKSHVRNIFAKLGVRDRTLAAVLALRAGLVD